MTKLVENNSVTCPLSVFDVIDTADDLRDHYSRLAYGCRADAFDTLISRIALMGDHEDRYCAADDLLRLADAYDLTVSQFRRLEQIQAEVEQLQR